MRLTGRPFREWFNRESLSALAAIIGVACLIALAAFLLTGCAGGQVFASLQHRSSIPDTRDRATSDTLGLCGEVNLCAEARCGDYTPPASLCFNYEITGNPTYGSDPSAHAEFRVPVKVWP